ncbi:tetratricopeptide repeat protein 28-like [Stylophora pistillata]|uniref:tetratricopeptide repeat protein 28-like n=1 Tax=Stylophora pistillata TaxID=50429 RepID=UPI000C0523BA|nr:tetratricopeptide repeat protein 28-like [Stylophora pistillata]
MKKMDKVIQTIHIGIVVAEFLQKTKRNLQAIKLCEECLLLLNNSAMGMEDRIPRTFYAKSNLTLLHAYSDMSDDANAERYARKLLSMSHDFGDTKGEGFFMLTLAMINSRQRKFKEAKKLYERAIGIMKATGERKLEALGYFAAGDLLESLYEYQKAKEYFEKVLAINMEIGDKRGEAGSYGNLGTVSCSLGELQKAKEYFEKALAIIIEIGDEDALAWTCISLGTVLQPLGDCQKAKEYYEKALAISMETGDKTVQVVTCRNLGNVLHSLDEHQKAKEYYEKALAISTEIGDKHEQASNCRNLGTVLSSLDEYQKAKECYEKALGISMQINDKRGQESSYENLGFVMENGYKRGEAANCATLENGYKRGEAANYVTLGNVLTSLGEYQKAKEYLKKALAISIKIGEKSGEAWICRSLQKLLRQLGNYQKAKEYSERALAIHIEIGDKGGEGNDYLNLGSLLLPFGKFHKAKEYYEKALAIYAETGNKKGHLCCYVGLGLTLCELGKCRDAKEYGEKALSIATEIGDRECHAKALNILGTVFEKLHDYQRAKEYYEKQLAISRKHVSREIVAKNCQELGKVFLMLGEYEKANEYLGKALAINCEIGDILNEFYTLLSLSVLRIQQSNSPEAFFYLYQSIAKYETLRNFHRENEDFKHSLLETVGAVPFEIFRILLCTAGNPQKALYVEELRRARCLADLMERNFSVENHISADLRSWFGIEEIVSKERNSAFLYISFDTRDVSLWVLKANGDTLFRKAENVDDETLMDEKAFDLNSYFNKSIRGFGVLPQQKCEDRSFNESLQILLHDESEADLRGEQAEDTERMLSVCFKLIIAPVADLLTEPEIIIVPERSLYRVPFAALRDQPGGKSLSETFRLRIVPSLTTLKLIQDCPVDYHSQTGALVVGNPKVGRARYRGDIHDFIPLACAEKEAKMIGQLLGVQPLLGERATREAVLQEISSVSLIHIAAHGKADRGEIALSPSPATSNISEEKDYLLRTSDILQVKVRAKLVVLSCCHSGRGEIKVEGIIGIARAFLASGARSVLVTLWAIEDEATEQFMRHFYRHLVDGFSASECLHQAMKRLRKIGYTKVSQWAPFMLIGDNVTFNFKEERKDELEEE